MLLRLSVNRLIQEESSHKQVVRMLSVCVYKMKCKLLRVNESRRIGGGTERAAHKEGGIQDGTDGWEQRFLGCIRSNLLCIILTQTHKSKQ